MSLTACCESMEEIKEEIKDDASPDGFQLGEWLGRRQAFGAIAGGCSAAEAECLRRIRDEKLYQARVPEWQDFCDRYLSMSRRHADRIIAYLEEFGPAYFRLSQLTRISPETYRAMQPEITDDGIHIDGEVIALDPENSERLAKAIAQARPPKAKPPEPPPLTSRERLAEVERNFDSLIVKIGILCLATTDAIPSQQIAATLRSMCRRLDEIEHNLTR